MSEIAYPSKWPKDFMATESQTRDRQVNKVSVVIEYIAGRCKVCGCRGHLRYYVVSFFNQPWRMVPYRYCSIECCKRANWTDYCKYRLTGKWPE